MTETSPEREPDIGVDEPERQPLDPPVPVPAWLRQSAIGLTAAHAALTVVAVAFDGLPRGIIAIVFLVVFLAAIGLFLTSFLSAANRSRNEYVTVVGAFFLGDGSVTALDRRVLVGATVVQSIVGIGGAILRPFTPVAFSVLVSLAGLAMMAFAGARYGRFEARE